MTWLRRWWWALAALVLAGVVALVPRRRPAAARLERRLLDVEHERDLERREVSNACRAAMDRARREYADRVALAELRETQARARELDADSALRLWERRARELGL